MIDREKVIKQLDEIGHYFFDIYRKEDDREEGCLALDRADVVADAIALLKEQEAVKPIEGYGYYICGICKQPLKGESRKFCPECGRKVKWDD